MTATAITPLDAWLRARIAQPGHGPLDPEALHAFQLRQLNATLDAAGSRSPFYRRLFSGRPPCLASLQDLSRLPFTTEADLRLDPLAFLCISQDRVARIVTLQTSGTTAAPKRVFFSGRDLEATGDFFEHGMATLAAPGSRVLILLPGGTPDSVGDLLARALKRLGAHPIPHGPVQDPVITAAAVVESRADCLVGIPVQVLSLARHPAGRGIPRGQVAGVLLTGDYVPRAVGAALADAWGCRVFQHYGMTETGFGGGVECAAQAGYHLREADLLFEIVDPATGRPLAGGQRGEVVVTTLDREAMPLIRYRTGDLAAWVPGPCPCGSRLRRMSPVAGRSSGALRLGDGLHLFPADLDEALFAVEGVLDYQAQVGAAGAGMRLEIRVGVGTARRERFADQVIRALEGIEAVGAAIAGGVLDIGAVRIEEGGMWTRGWRKRALSVAYGPGAQGIRGSPLTAGRQKENAVSRPQAVQR